jgi:hypothetical protein
MDGEYNEPEICNWLDKYRELVRWILAMRHGDVDAIGIDCRDSQRCCARTYAIERQTEIDRQDQTT